jgi:uncharacterized RDD family membrane protein YckC
VQTLARASPAGWGLRAVAGLIDGALVVLVQASLAATAAVVVGLTAAEEPAVAALTAAFTGLFAALYTTVLHARCGQTVGKLLVGLVVVGEDGRPLGMGAAFLRHVGYALSALPFGFGFLMAALRHDRRALHDLLAASRVVRLAPQPRGEPAPAEVPGVE